MYNKKTCKQTYFRIPKCFWEAFHLSWTHQPHREIQDHHRGSDSATAPRKPALIPKLHRLDSCQLSPRTTAGLRWCGGCHRQRWPGNSMSRFKQYWGLGEMSKTVPKGKASFPAVSQQHSSSAPVAITRLQKGKGATGGEWAADRGEPTGSNCPCSHVSSCYSSSSWWSFKPIPIHLSLSKLKQQLLSVHGEPKAPRTTRTCKSCKKCN